MVTLNVNDRSYDVDVDPDTPLLWAIRDGIGLTGTKYGCGIAMCGACTVHVGGTAKRSCVTPCGEVTGDVLTIEGLGGEHPVQQAWREENVPQCGYCQAGQIMSACALLQKNRSPSDADIEGAMSGNICRCGTYTRIRSAIKLAAGIKEERA